MNLQNQPLLPTDPDSRWHENHGNLLMGFVGVVFLIGACILVYRQNRFVPVRFPESDMIDVPIEPDEEITNAVTLNVIGAANDFGSIKIAVFDSEKTFNRPADAVLLKAVPIVEGQAIWKVPHEHLPARIAIAVYHDENRDDELNRNRLGIPTERYGFSRNARGLTGPPSFKQTVIDRPAVGETIDLFIR